MIRWFLALTIHIVFLMTLPNRVVAQTVSFEDVAAGAFQTFASSIGNWQNPKGDVRIRSGFAYSGNQCLQLSGGDHAASIELDVAKTIGKSGTLIFRAERWTKRAPFSLTIERWHGDGWHKIFDGNQVKVGRGFLSKVEVSIGNTQNCRLRFLVTSPANTGVLIDDVSFVADTKQELVDVGVVPLALPVLLGDRICPLLKVKVTTRGSLEPISVTSLKVSLDKDAQSKLQQQSLKAFFTEDSPSFSPDVSFGNPQVDAHHIAFEGKQVLVPGDNYFWVAGSPKAEVNIDEMIKIVGKEIQFGEVTKSLNDAAWPLRMGIALRDRGDENVNTFRIPGLVTTNDGTLIAVYDVRYDSSVDLPGNIDVGMSRSTDGGRTWEPMKIILDMGSDPKWRSDGVGDPAILVDRVTGTIWVSATWSHGDRSWRGSGPGMTPEETGQWMLVKSDDDGRTWSDPINITEQVKTPELAFLLQGPGKGIMMHDGTLVFPAQYQNPLNPEEPKLHRLPHSTFIYSKDRGATWSLATAPYGNTTESQIVELGDGELMINCRNNRTNRRAVFTTKDLGRTWSQHETHERDLIEPRACMASLINVGRELGWRDLSGAADSLLLFSNPDSFQRRSHITIKASKDSGMTWPTQHQLLLDEGVGRGYSCMSMIDSTTVGILYEGSQADLTFQRVKLADVLNPPVECKTKNPNVVQRYLKPTKPAPPAELSLGKPFGDNMVLQAGRAIRVWGQAPPNTTVAVSLRRTADTTDGDSFEVEAMSDANGRWSVELPAHEPSVEPHVLTVQAENQKVELSNVLIGEVWICAGQSNMAWPLGNTTSGPTAIESSTDPLLRVFHGMPGATGGGVVYGEREVRRLIPESFFEGRWKEAVPESVSGFSAVGYYFGQRLRSALDVPVGVINVAVGGTPIESWTDSVSLRKSSLTQSYEKGIWYENQDLDGWIRSRAKLNLKRMIEGELECPGDRLTGPNHPFKPTFMHQAAIEPFGPFQARGWLWYQGESNAANPSRIESYDACFPMLVKRIRELAERPEMPVGFVQLPTHDREHWPLFREYQRRSLSKLTNVGVAITIDTGHPTDVHPRLKRPVGDRLSHWALVDVYQEGSQSMGPLLKSKQVHDGGLIIEFENSKGLKTRDGEPVRYFELAGADQVFHPAEATIESDRVFVRCDAVKEPVEVRYAWAPHFDTPPNLVNQVGLPASPFTTEESLDAYRQ